MANQFLASVASLSGSRVFVVLSQILILPIVARYLEVSDFGDMALAMTVVIFAQLFSDAGFSRSLIRQPEYHPEEWSSVFWFLVAVGVTITALLVFIAPLWSWVFARPTLGPLVAALSVVPLLSALNAVPTAHLERTKRFPTIAVIRTVAAAVGFAVAVALAMRGAAAWALVTQQIAIAVVQCVGAAVLSRFRPLSPRIRVPLGDHLVFARNTLGVSLIFTAQRQLPMMMIGYALGAASLGFYAMGQRIFNLPTRGLAGPVAQVTFVGMSRVQHDTVLIARMYIASMKLLALAIFPPMAVLAGVGETAFAMLLSEPWRPVATIFALAVTGVALDASTSAVGVAFQAVNRTELRLRMVSERAVLRLTLIAAALPFGLEAVAAAITISAVLYLPRMWTLFDRAVSLDKAAALTALAGPMVVGLLLWVVAGWIEAETSGWATLLWAALLLCTTWLPALLVMHKRPMAVLSN